MADEDEFIDYGDDDDEIIEDDDFDVDDDIYDDDEFQGSSSNIHESSSKDLYRRLQRAEMMAEEGKNLTAGNLRAPDEGFNYSKLMAAQQSIPIGIS